MRNHLLAKAFGKHTNMDLGYCSLQVGREWQWPLRPRFRGRGGEIKVSGVILVCAAFKNTIKTKMLCNSKNILKRKCTSAVYENVIDQTNLIKNVMLRT